MHFHLFLDASQHIIKIIIHVKSFFLLTSFKDDDVHFCQAQKYRPSWALFACFFSCAFVNIFQLWKGRTVRCNLLHVSSSGIFRHKAFVVIQATTFAFFVSPEMLHHTNHLNGKCFCDTRKKMF